MSHLFKILAISLSSVFLLNFLNSWLKKALIY